MFMLTSDCVLCMNRLPFSVNFPNFTGLAYVHTSFIIMKAIDIFTKLTTGITIVVAEILSNVDNLDVTQSSL